MRRRYYFHTLLTSTVLAAVAGCGTTRATDTGRTATEQLLISDAVDRAVQTVNFGTLAGQSVYLDDSRLNDVVDRNYLISTLRQHLLASGCSLRTKADEADYVVEVRAGAVGTDRNDLLFGVPSMNVPQIMPMQPVPAAIPEIPIAKRRDQRGIAKIAVFAYHRPTGKPVWQSGVSQTESSSNDVWILGAGPFRRGTIYDGTEFAGNALGDSQQSANSAAAQRRSLALSNEQVFARPAQIAATSAAKSGDTKLVQQAAAQEPISPPPQGPSLETRTAALKSGSTRLPSEQAQASAPAPRQFDPLTLPQPRNEDP
jgi:hypothetical protein